MELDAETAIFYGEVLDTRDVITFQGKSVDEVQAAFRESIDDYLEFCAQRGGKPDKPFSGRTLSSGHGMGRFRPATALDVEAILAMMRGYYSEDGYALVEVEARAAVLELIGDDSLGRLWVAEESGEVVGYLAVTLGFSLEHRGRDAFVDELFVSEAWRGRGLGREALATAEAYCREKGVKALHLEVERHRETAIELYRRAGFEEHDHHLMTKRL